MSSSSSEDLYFLLRKLGGRSRFLLLCQGVPWNRGVGFCGHSSMANSTVIVDLHVLHIEFGGNSGFVSVSRSPSEPWGWLLWP